MNVENKCPVCNGEGKRILWGKPYDCPKCSGTGLDPSAITFNFNNPETDDKNK